MSERITFLAMDARATPFTDNSFGAVAMLDALHHLEEGSTVFAEMWRVLAPTGRLLLAEMTPEGFALIARVHASEGACAPGRPGHVRGRCLPAP